MPLKFVFVLTYLKSLHMTIFISKIKKFFDFLALTNFLNNFAVVNISISFMFQMVQMWDHCRFSFL